VELDLIHPSGSFLQPPDEDPLAVQQSEIPEPGRLSCFDRARNTRSADI
jgi:hypothetical protein